MFPLCYICFTKIVQFEKRNSGDLQLIFIFTYKYTNKQEQSKTKLALILFSRAKVSSSFNSNIVKGECKGKRNLHFRLGSTEPYPIFYKDSEKRAEEKWPRFFILNHIVK